MSSLKFIQKMQELFGLSPENAETKKKKAIKELVKKLKLRYILLKQELKQEADLIKRETLLDSIKIIKKQMEKGKDIVDD